ncbi:hypothetical protein EMCRGX_G034129 [Ephydatia muelleri]
MSVDIDEHISTRYQICRRIGKGAYGIVWKSVDRRTGEIVALKKIFDAFSNQTDAQRTYREVMFLDAFSGHENVIQLLNVISALNNMDLYLVFEFMDTDLHAAIKSKLLHSPHVQYILYQILKVIMYIHSGNCIHRDLKPSNILINSQCFIKLADFGLMRSLTSIPFGEENIGFNPIMTEYVATRWYRAPEILLGSQRYTKGVDMWSVGCILAEMMSGKPLFDGTSTLNQIERIMTIIPHPTRADIESIKSPYAQSILEQVLKRHSSNLRDTLPCPDEDALKLLNELLRFNPDKRITAEQALLSPYMHRFHCPENEPTLDHDVVPTLNDCTQLSVQNYQDMLYKGISHTRAALKSEREHTPLHSTSDTELLQTASRPGTKGLEGQPQSPSPATPLKSQTRATKPKDSERPRLPPAAHFTPTPPSKPPPPDLTLTSARIVPTTRPQYKKPQCHGGPSQYATGAYTQTHGTISQTALRHLQHMTQNN